MQVRRFLGKIAGTYLAIGALSVSAYAAADVYPGPGPVGAWGHGPVGGPVVGGPVGGDGWIGSAPACCPSPVQQQSCCQQEICNPPPVCGVAYNPAGYFNCNNNCNPCNGGFFDSLRVRADFLWWRAAEECLSLGTEESYSFFPEGVRFERSREKSPDFKYDPGFRIGIATVCPCESWDLAVNWTHFHTKANVSGASELGGRPVTGEGGVVLANQETIFVPQWQRLTDAIPDFSKGRWTLDLDLVDLEFGRKFYVSNSFILRPHFGLRGARIDQGFRVRSEANRFDLYEDLGTAFFVSQTKAKNNFLGIGPRVGLDLELSMPCWCNVKLFGQAAGSLLFGRFERHSREFFRDFTEADLLYDGLPSNLEYEGRATKERTSRAVTDLAIGLKWEHCCNWCNRSHPITLAVAWEHHAFFNFNNFIFERAFTGAADTIDTAGAHGSRCGGDLTTQGLTVTAEIGF